MTAAAVIAPPAPPAPGRAVQVVPGLEWLRIAVPGALRHINVWLLEDADGCTLVDTGMNLPESRAAWEGPLGAVLGGRRLRRIVCTHHHPDHAGLAGWLAARHGAEVWMSDAEVAVLRRIYAQASDPAQAARRCAVFRRDGFDPVEAELGVMAVDGFLEVMSGLPDEVRTLSGGDVLEAGGRTWRVLELRGHTEGQLVLHAPDPGLLISGDQVLPRITSNIGIYPEGGDPDPLHSYLDSFAPLAALDPEPLVLPSHGEPFPGLRARLDALRRHHDEQLAAVLALCRSPATAAEVSLGLYRRELDPLNRMLAFAETLAHLRALEVRGRVAVRETAGGPRRFVATPGG